MNLAQLRKHLKTLQDGIADLETKATAADAAADATEALEKHIDAIEAAEAKIKVLEKAEATRAKMAKPAADELDAEEDADDEIEQKGYARPKETLTPRKQLEWIIGGVVKAHEDLGRSSPKNVLKAMSELGYAGYAKDLDGMMKKNVNTGTGTAGGFTIPLILSSELIPLLYRQATFANAGARLTPMPNGNFERSGMATGASAGYRGEGTQGTHTQATFRKIDMKAKLLYGITSLTDQMKRWSFGDMQRWITDDLETATALVYDQSCYIGDGVGNNPLGIFNLVGNPAAVAAGFATAGAPTAAELDGLGRRMEAVQDNVNMDSDMSGWVMASRTINWMRDLRLPNSDEFAYPELRGNAPTWRGKKVTKSNAIPTNLGAGTNESFIGLVHWRNILDGRSLGLTIKASDVASFSNGGKTVHAFSEGATLILAEMEHDVESEYNQAVVKSGPIVFG